MSDKQHDPDLDFDDKPQAALSHPSYEELEAQLTAAEMKADEQLNKALRCQADLENMRRRTERDLTQAHRYALERFAQEILPVVDNLERSLEHKVADDLKTLHEGVELTLKLMNSVLEKFSIKPVHPAGSAFDPAHHEAMTMQESTEHAPGTVLTVLQKGYLLHDRLLRPALVVVAKTAEK